MNRLAYLMLGLLLCAQTSVFAQSGHESRASGAEPTVIKMGTVISEREGVFPHHMLSTQKHLARQIEANTNGEVVLEVLGADSISPREMAAAVAKGDVLQAANLNTFFYPKVPELLIQSIPFLFTGAEHSRRFPMSEPAQWMARKIEEAYDVKALGFLLVASDVAIGGVEPVKELSDFTGKVLNGSRDTDNMFDDVKPSRIEHIGFGAAARGELVESDVEITVGLVQNIDVQRWYERFEHVTLAQNYYNVYYTPIVNKDVWNGLTDRQREGIEAAMRDAENAAVAYQHDSMMWAYQLGQSRGVQMRMQTDAERRAWKAEFYPVITELAISSSSNRDETREMIEKIEDLVKDLEWR